MQNLLTNWSPSGRSSIDWLKYSPVQPFGTQPVTPASRRWMMRVAGDKAPFDRRLIVNGYLPDYAYDRGAIDTSMPAKAFHEFERLGVRSSRCGPVDHFHFRTRSSAMKKLLHSPYMIFEPSRFTTQPRSHSRRARSTRLSAARPRECSRTRTVSYEVYFAPEAPEGKTGNWLQTVPGKSWFPLLRMYGHYRHGSTGRAHTRPIRSATPYIDIAVLQPDNLRNSRVVSSDPFKARATGCSVKRMYIADLRTLRRSM